MHFQKNESKIDAIDANLQVPDILDVEECANAKQNANQESKNGNEIVICNN